ncbi:6-phosphogluconolactonase [Nocardioides sp. S-58]|uniref:6-phosphogluconolactonase n=1 Tax=Nocardioides renjunii TaxID=3095075 RepID=A0ABU5KF11_9ACTN|nr:6-phosphogluconolactonase [Nocardioides sp. S-58]MDZ5663555.1 6-phosphogluconolactonase [Nocardioides sp. S-58]
MTDAPRVSRHQDADVLVGDVASALLDRIETAQARGDVPHVALTGGSIAESLHRELARRAPDSSVDWSRVEFWWGDERFVTADSPDRNALPARSEFLDVVGVDPAHVHEVPSSDQVATAEESAAAYAETLRARGVESFEVMILGLGPDGHCASLFPGHPGLAVSGVAVTAVHDSPKPPPDRVTLTFEALNRARSVWFIASGEGKAEAVARALADEGSVEETPARGVRGHETVWWLDEPAASALPALPALPA